MKVDRQGDPKFVPVQITLESEEELQMLAIISGYNSSIAEMIADKGYRTDFDKSSCNQFLSKLNTSLREFQK